MSINITEAQKTLLNLVGNNLFSAPLDIETQVDWDSVIREIKAHTVELIALKNHRTLPIDKTKADNLQKQLKSCTICNINCINGHKYLHELMAKNNISYCIVKGVASSKYYPDPLLRSMGDVDFYVPPEYFDKAVEVLKADGFVCKDKNHQHHIKFKKGTMRYELHFAPLAIPNDEMRPIFFEYWSDICEKASLYKDIFADYVLPSDFHHGFIMLTHFETHLLSSGSGLRHVCDWAVFVNSLSNEEFISLFETKLKRIGLWKLAKALSLVAVKYLGMPHKKWMGEDFANADALVIDVLKGGNFGRRENDRIFEGVFVSECNNTGVNKPALFQKIDWANNIVKRKWKAAKKYPLLLPIGWFYFPMRFVFNLIIGRRKVNIFNSYKQIKKRSKLYAELELFKPEV